MNNMDKNTKIAIAILIVGIIVAIFILKSDSKNDNTTNSTQDSSDGYYINDRRPEDENVYVEGREIIREEKIIIDEEYSSVDGDISIIKTEESGDLTLTGATISKYGDTSSLRNSDAYGQNSAILATDGSSISIEGTNVTTSGKGSSGVVSYNNGTQINVSDTQISTDGERSRGLLATGGGSISASNLNITTNGYKSSGVATDTGGGNITISNSSIRTTNEDSAGIYSTGSIIAQNSTIISENSEAIVIDGYNIANLTNCNITAGKNRGIMLLYTGPSEQQGTTGIVKLRNNVITVKEGPLFYVTNTDADITLENNQITLASNKLLEVCIDKYNVLGQEHPVENPVGGYVKLTAKNQVLSGSIEADNVSSVTLTLENSKYSGCINKDQSAKTIKVKLDDNSVWNLTGDSYIDILDIENGTINRNGYNLYVKGVAYTY